MSWLWLCHTSVSPEPSTSGGPGTHPMSHLKKLNWALARRTCQGHRVVGLPQTRRGLKALHEQWELGIALGSGVTLVSSPSSAARGSSGTAAFSRLQLQLNPVPGLRRTVTFFLILTDSEGVACKGELRSGQLPRHKSARWFSEEGWGCV